MDKSSMIRMYYSLEHDTNELGSTIHFDERNLDTFGIRVYNLLFISCNLFELAAKETVCDPESTMKTWKKNPRICLYSRVELTFIPMGCKFKPMGALGENDVEKRNLAWWQDYNSVKHDLTQIHKATLRNLIYALGSAGLLVSEIARPPMGMFYTPKRSVLFDYLAFPEQ
jgi:hypothetical protein